MNFKAGKFCVVAMLLLLASVASFAAAPSKKNSPSARSNSSKGKHSATKKSRKPRGQQAIDGERARQIQQALVREHYLNGQPSGKWDDSTQGALRRYQADQGWQSKSVPDARALIRLGLGPDQGHLLNPESAMTTEPQLPHNTTRVNSSVTHTAKHAAAPPSSIPAQNSVPVAIPVDISPGK